MFRKVLFWVHLVAGIISGLSIGAMCFTGTVLAFEKELVAWAERDARRVEVPANAQRLTLEQMQAKLREAQPEARPMSIVLQNDPAAAVAFSSGRAGGFYVNPYTGEVRQPQSKAMADFMHTMVDTHRYLNFHGEESRPRGKLINGVCNIAFCVLAITGLYLWMPRNWSWRAIRPVIWFRQNNTSKARDFNWHNAIGFWTAPVLIVLTLTAIPISFRWGGDVINKLTGTPAPAPGAAQGPGAFAAPAVEIPTPPAGARPLSQDALIAAAQKAAPNWTTMTIRVGGPGGPGGRGGAGGGRGGRGGRGGGEVGAAGGQGAPTTTGQSAAPTSSAPAADAPAAVAPRGEGRGPGGEGRGPGGEGRGGAGGEARGGASATPQAATFTIREAGTWPRTANTTLSLNPFTGEVLRRTGYADMAAAQQVRSWTRFLHTGEALGKVGQFVAGLACLGGVFLVYTGFALSWRRFFGKRRSSTATAPAATASAQAASTAS